MERTQFYTYDIPHERARLIPDKDPGADWPRDGRIVFEVCGKLLLNSFYKLRLMLSDGSTGRANEVPRESGAGAAPLEH